jgi:hypothetical protein
MSTAETIAASLNNDGQIFEANDGTTLDELLEQAPRFWQRNDGVTVHVFADGSMILGCDHGWDIVTVENSEWRDSNSETWAVLDENGEPEGWSYRRS